MPIDSRYPGKETSMNDKSNSVVLDDQDLYIIEVATSAQPGDFPITKGGICPLPHGACFPGEVGRGLHPGAGASRSRDTVGWVHDKHAMRARLRAVGLEDTAAALVTDREMLHAFAAKHGLPLVVKPNGGVASVGVSVARTPADLDACFATAVAEHGAFSSPGVLAERFFEGPQFSIEGRSSTRSGCEESGPDPDVTVAAHAQPGAARRAAR
jgi:hypothetical protein